MPVFAANLSMLFTEVPLLERIEHAAQAGFRHVEFQFPYAEPAEAIRAQLDRYGVQAVLHNVPAGQWEGGERGIACHPDRVDEFRAGLSRALHYARVLGVPRINVLAGKAPAGVPADVLRRTLVANLRHAAQEFARAGVALLVEPLNSFDVPGFYLNRTAQALELLDEVGAGNAFVQYDVYHAQRMEGEIAATLERHLARIGHVQIADNPGRHEPGTGELNWDFLFAHLDRIGYRGQVGAEYKPASTTQAGLGWLQRFSR
jgi:hydroxypyruvate isomerase